MRHSFKHKHTFKVLKNRNKKTPSLIIPYRGRTYYIKGKQMSIFDRAETREDVLQEVFFIAQAPIPNKISTINGIENVLKVARKHLTKTRQAQIERFYFEHYT